MLKIDEVGTEVEGCLVESYYKAYRKKGRRILSPAEMAGII